MADFRALLELLCRGRIDFILVGGVAAVVHGSGRLTQDLDIVYDRDPANLRRLASSLATVNPALRGAPPGLPFRLDEETLRRGLNFTLTTDLGALDLFGELAGGGGFADLIEHTIEIEVFGLRCRVLDLDTLIRVKRAAGRPRDLEAIAELERIREETG